jgi:alpha-maltose-1-phosphate synthase
LRHRGTLPSPRPVAAHTVSSEGRITAVTAGAPFDRMSRSGDSYHLFSALQATGALSGVVDARPPALDLAEKLGAARNTPDARLQRLDTSSTATSPLVRGLMTTLAWQRARAVSRQPDVLLQIGAWYDPARLPGLSPRLRCSYHDGNLAVYLRRPDLALDSSSWLVRRTWAFEQRLYDRLDLILPRSEWLRRSFIEDFAQDPQKVVAVGAGANLDAVPALAPRDWSSPRLLFVGRDFARKGGPELLAAFAGLRRRRRDAELWIVGPPLRFPPSGASTNSVLFAATRRRARPRCCAFIATPRRS